ncbi:helix-turn-helix domain-containing protein [Parapedobacter indicus]|uniref:Helix-turn-helix n=1 Tax=Parapedobacter indicus TaxID=1477437 RepID=A0A1I3DPR2_9SPHI|nr:helix-turn-helix transcriptional regulator [Parapedobacter indicus]PPL04787.1 helix-turn-helix protein [Parapedobacter indicus]SFH88707.1 Helix-turn-helix [Parapedobacter indicus]
MTDPVKPIGQLVKAGRIEKNYTQQQLAELSGISLRSVQRIESGQVSPRRYTLNLLADILETDFSERQPVPEATSNNFSRERRLILSIGLGLLWLLLGLAYVFQSPFFPETAFELMLYIAGFLTTYLVVLWRLWR